VPAQNAARQLPLSLAPRSSRLTLKVHDHDGLHLGHLWLELIRRQVALPVCELVVAKPARVRAHRQCARRVAGAQRARSQSQSRAT
jgi:hypothetical protein